MNIIFVILCFFLLGSVYFSTAKMLAATDRLELLCCQANVQSHGMMQFE